MSLIGVRIIPIWRSRSVRCYPRRMNPILEDAIVAIATTLGAWLFAQQLSLLW